MDYEKAIVIAETKFVADEYNKFPEEEVKYMRAYVCFLTGSNDYGENASDKEFPDFVVEVMQSIDDLDEVKLVRDAIMDRYFSVKEELK